MASKGITIKKGRFYSYFGVGLLCGINPSKVDLKIFFSELGRNKKKGEGQKKSNVSFLRCKNTIFTCEVLTYFKQN